jgi:hypothetical protein
MIRLTENRETAPYAWVNSDEDHKATLSKIGVLKPCSKHCLEQCSSIRSRQARCHRKSDCANPIDVDEHVTVAEEPSVINHGPRLRYVLFDRSEATERSIIPSGAVVCGSVAEWPIAHRVLPSRLTLGAKVCSILLRGANRPVIRQEISRVFLMAGFKETYERGSGWYAICCRFLLASLRPCYVPKRSPASSKLLIR